MTLGRVTAISGGSATKALLASWLEAGNEPLVRLARSDRELRSARAPTDVRRGSS
jgi:hypothetical protein